MAEESSSLLYTQSSIWSRMNFGREKNERPSSLPRNWPHPTEEDLLENPKRIINIGKEQTYHFKSNFVKTSKYEIYDFVPKFLLEEFNPRTKIANCYFLAISVLQCIPQISNTGGYPTTLIPLLFVVVVDGIFQILEDMSRHRADKEANSSNTLIYDPLTQTFIKKQWLEVQVGDFVKILSRDQIPADVAIIGVAEKTAHPQGLCYVETKSLDGETNLKIKHCMPQGVGKVIIIYFILFLVPNFTLESIFFFNIFIGR